MTTQYHAKAFYDPRTEGYFGRVQTHINGKMVRYDTVRICRPCKADAQADADLVAQYAARTGKVDCGVVY